MGGCKDAQLLDSRPSGNWTPSAPVFEFQRTFEYSSESPGDRKCVESVDSFSPDFESRPLEIGHAKTEVMLEKIELNHS
jgi:hypothetical protein